LGDEIQSPQALKAAPKDSCYGDGLDFNRG
jgi:hypothetical protein